jgi:hypothetical protein
MSEVLLPLQSNIRLPNLDRHFRTLSVQHLLLLDQKDDFGEDSSFIYYGKYPILILMKTPIVKPVGLKI